MNGIGAPNIISIKTSLPTYLRNFGLENEDILLFHKKKESVAEDNCSVNIHTKSENNTMATNNNDSKGGEFELTGSPLEVDLNEQTFSSIITKNEIESFTKPINYWTVEESKHYPLALQIARRVINSSIKARKQPEDTTSTNSPIFAVCDGNDSLCTVIIGYQKKNNYLMTTAVYLLGWCQMDKGLLTLDNIKKDHKKNTRNKVQDSEIDFLVQMKYIIYGKSLQSSMPQPKSENKACVSVSVTCNKCVYEVPQNVSNMQMNLQIIPGHKLSSVYFLWEDLCLLEKYLDIMSNQDICNDNSTFLCDVPLEESVIFDGINNLMSGYSLKREVKKEFDLQNLREDNLLDKLWKLFKYCENISVLRKCFHYLFEELTEAKVNIIIKEDGLNISSIINGIISGKLIISAITCLQALELLFELGAEKLKNDYKAIMKHFFCSEQAIDMIWSKFHEDEQTSQTCYRKTRITQNLKAMGVKLNQNIKKLAYLGQMHLASELIFLIKEQVNLRHASFDYFCECVVKNYIENSSKMEEFAEMREKGLCEFSFEINSADLSSVQSLKPVRWTMHMTSHFALQKLEVTTIYDLSTTKIFPTCIHDHDVPLEDAVGEDSVYYYISKMVRYKDYNV